MRDVNFGWLIRYLHANGASMFFIATYVHLFRGLYYGSYKAPRELLWILGVLLLLLMMATAFMGYVLPWGQMSFWGATVITNLFSAIPVVGQSIVTWLWGGFGVDNPTLNRFFSLHYLLPFILLGVVGLHVAALHVTGSNNPLGIDVKGPQDTLPFHPYYTIKDSVGLCVFLARLRDHRVLRAGFLQQCRQLHSGQSTLHAVGNRSRVVLAAVLRDIALGAEQARRRVHDVRLDLLLFVLPWLDTSPVRSCKFRPIYRQLIWVLVVAVVALGMVGAHRPEGLWVVIGRVATLYYFAHFLVILPVLGKLERPLPLPESISKPVLTRGGGGPLPGGAPARPMEKH